MNTRTKIAIASLIYRCLRLVRVRQHRIIRRNGIDFDVDLAEGIDLSLFLFGSFQKWVIDDSILPKNRSFTALDIGANVGAVCLPLAARDAEARVIAIEPTAHGIKRLRRNIDLNPHLAPRIQVVNCFMGSTPSADSKQVAYPSWRLDSRGADSHAVHCGEAHQVTCPTLTIDSLASDLRLEKLDFIKIDTDGHELDILRGGRETLRRFRPSIVFEFCFYENEKRGYSFEDFAAFFRDLGYELRLCDNKKLLTDEASARRAVPELGSRDFLAIPLPA